MKKSKKSPGANSYEWFIKTADVSKYAGKWIAVENRKIVASDAKIEKLLKEIKYMPDVAITKVPKRGQIMVL